MKNEKNSTIVIGVILFVYLITIGSVYYAAVSVTALNPLVALLATIGILIIPMGCILKVVLERLKEIEEEQDDISKY